MGIKNLKCLQYESIQHTCNSEECVDNFLNISTVFIQRLCDPLITNDRKHFLQWIHLSFENRGFWSFFTTVLVRCSKLHWFKWTILILSASCICRRGPFYVLSYVSWLTYRLWGRIFILTGSKFIPTNILL